jgi:hypothetical protein
MWMQVRGLLAGALACDRIALSGGARLTARHDGRNPGASAASARDRAESTMHAAIPERGPVFVNRKVSMGVSMRVPAGARMRFSAVTAC